MSDKRKHIDDLFKEGFEGLELNDTGNVWDRVEETLHGKKPKRPFGFWLWSAVAIVALGLTALFVFRPEASETDQIENISSDHENRIVDQQINTGGNEHALNSARLPEDQQEQNEKQELEQNEKQEQEQNEERKQEQNEERKQELNEKQPLAEKATESPAQVEESPAQVEESPAQVEESPAPTAGSSDPPHADNPGTDSEHNAPPTVADSGTTETARDIAIQEVEQKPLDSANTENGENKADQTVMAKPVDTTEKMDPNDPEPVQKVRQPIVSIGIAAGSLRSRQVVETGLQGFSDYSTLKSGNENPAYGFTAGMLVNATWALPNNTAGFTVSSGMNITDVRFNTPVIRFVVRDSFPLLNPQGDTIAMIPKTPVDSLIRNQDKLIYRGFTIPLEVGYVMGLTDRVELMVTAGANLNIITGITGRTIDSRMELKNAEDLNYRKYNLGFSSSLGMNYAVGKNLKISFELRYAQFAPDLYKDDVSGNTRISTYGLRTAVYYEIRH